MNPTPEQIEAAEKFFRLPHNVANLASLLASREAAARAEERERCAKVAETALNGLVYTASSVYAEQVITAAIRRKA